jgi:hypothetical protein
MARFLNDWQEASDTLGQGSASDDGRQQFKTS